MIPLRDDVRAERRPYVNYLFIGGCAVVFGWQMLTELNHAAAGDAMVRTFGMIPANIIAGKKLWTLLTSMFLHGGIFHFLGNMLYLWIFGDNVEDSFGHAAYVLVYLVSGVFGSLLQILVTPHSAVPTIGASGAISGVMGAYFVLYPRARVLTVIPIFFFIRLMYLPASLLLGFWILLQILYGCSSAAGTSGIAYFAHIGGFLVGVILALLVRKRVRRPWYEIS